MRKVEDSHNAAVEGNVCVCTEGTSREQVSNRGAKVTKTISQENLTGAGLGAMVAIPQNI